MTGTIIEVLISRMMVPLMTEGTAARTLARFAGKTIVSSCCISGNQNQGYCKACEQGGGRFHRFVP
tara:strand:- start:448 stop:645 length:198 start_codon:yes stop_codon:yes gene_type:complete